MISSGLIVSVHKKKKVKSSSRFLIRKWISVVDVCRVLKLLQSSSHAQQTVSNQSGVATLCSSFTDQNRITCVSATLHFDRLILYTYKCPYSILPFPSQIIEAIWQGCWSDCNKSRKIAKFFLVIDVSVHEWRQLHHKKKQTYLQDPGRRKWRRNGRVWKDLLHLFTKDGDPFLVGTRKVKEGTEVM